MSESIIRLKNVTKEYVLGDGSIFVSLKDVSMAIDSGEYVSIVGQSGSGKSTLMHIIGLLDKPTNGKVLINGADAAHMDDNHTSSLRNEFVGFVFQQFNLLNKLTIKENILLPVTYSRRELNFDPDERAEYLMDKFGILSKKDSYPNKISGGQQQRVAIARALIMNPQMLLADEPTGNLDHKTGLGIIELFEKLNTEDKVTVVMVTHEMEIANKARRLIKIFDGEIVK